MPRHKLYEKDPAESTAFGGVPYCEKKTTSSAGGSKKL